MATSELSPQTIRQLDELVAHEQVDGKLPTLVLGLVREGELRWVGERGTTGLPDGGGAAVDRQYRIGSISKTFVAVAVMRLRDEGALGLNDLVGTHLSELADLPVTIAQLLSHTSGLPAETAGEWWERVPGAAFGELLAGTLRPDRLLWRPGRRFHYSNVGYAVLGELVARNRSQSFWDFVGETLWEPLGMRHTSCRPVAPFVQGFAVHPHNATVLVEPEHDAMAMAPAGQLWSTLEDLGRWAGLLCGCRPDLLPVDTLSEMAEPIGVSDVPDQPWTSAYGLGLQQWNENGRRLYGHLGAMPGHWAALLVERGTKDAVVAVANSTYRGMRVPFFQEALAVFGQASPAVDAWATSAASADPLLTELVGTWYWGPVEARVSVSPSGKLEIRGVHGTGRDCDFVARGNGTFIGEYGYYEGERLTPHRGADGSITHLDIASFVYTRAPYEPADVVPGGVDPRGWLDTWPPKQD
ncbi:MAG TPA: serine hydrolase domain-containing protein [Acidimicrobiales bacterium]|nr:serine hydrolase domain-containing protein [Acidimicrobiales bacterium]